MRLFGYYAVHTFVNQLRKLFKTWVLIFIVACALVGGLIGYSAAMLSDVADSRSESSVSESVYEEEETAEDEEEADVPSAQTWMSDLMNSMTSDQLVELVAGLVILALFVIEIMSADKNGSKIFLPADVNLLFPSPMKPQSVLMFRLSTQIGLILVSTLYLAFQLPNLVLNVGMSAGAGVGLLGAWFLAILIAKLLNILCYTITATYPEKKKYLRNGVYGVLLALVAGCLLYSRVSGQNYLVGVAAFLNHPVTRWIPLWGWLKWFCVCVAAGDVTGAVLSMALTLAASVVLIFLIWNIKADFYEDAMAKSEHTAQVMELQQAEKSTGFVRRKKDRSEKIRRDTMRYGSGANVFFFKSLYNRFRFAHLGVFTKTTETYLVAAVVVSVTAKFIMGADTYLPAVLAIGAFVFYRTLGNPLYEDTSKDFFRMIPESAWAKLFWSILGGTVNCLLDILPALIVIAGIYRAQALLVFAWIPVILTVDFYGTNVGTFINLSVPISAGKIVKQFVQIMFIYFGLLPTIGVLAVGIVYGKLAIAALIASLICAGLGFLFLAFTPRFLEYREKTYRPVRAFTAEELQTAKKIFSRLGLGCIVLLVVTSVLQIVMPMVIPQLMEYSWGIWVYTFAPLYLIGVPICVALLARVPKPAAPAHWQGSRMGVGRMTCVVFVSIAAMYAGNIIGTVVMLVINAVKGHANSAAITTYATSENVWLKLLFMVILAPMIEEFLFRRMLIDRMRPYGEKLAVVTTAVMFGLFHGNFTQFFYACALGLVFGYVYVNTGKLRYSIGLHMGINFLGSIVAPWVVEQSGLEKMLEVATEDPAALEGISALGTVVTPGYILYMVYVFGLLGAAIAGLVIYLVKHEKIQYRLTELELPAGKRFRVAWLNVGMLLFVLGCAALFVISSIQ